MVAILLRKLRKSTVEKQEKENKEKIEVAKTDS